MSEFLLNDALTFLTIVEEGNFATAAKKLGISSSVVSKRISRLESQLHAQLLQRTTRSIALTEAGQLFNDHCKRIRAQINDAAQEILEHHQHPAGSLRINAPMSFGQVHLMPAINDFMAQYPDIQIDLLLGSQYANYIHNGLDVAIFINDVPDTKLLCSERIALRSTGVYGSPAYFKRKGVPKKPADLANHNCLIYQSEPGTYVSVGQKRQWSFIENKEKTAVSVSGSLRVNSSRALVKAAVAGIGLVRLSSFMVTDELKNGELISVLPEYCPHDIDIHAVYPNQRYIPSKVKVLIEFLIKRFNSDFYWETI